MYISTSLLGVNIYIYIYMYIYILYYTCIACGVLPIDQTLAIVLTDFTGRSDADRTHRLSACQNTVLLPLGRLVFEHVRTLQPNFLDEAG